MPSDSRIVKLGNRVVGEGYPVFIVAEIGINHNGDLNLVKQLIAVAQNAGCDAVKFQKRTPHVCVPEHQKDIMMETPWGYITYLEYKYKMEFGEKQYEEIDKYCQERNILWFASCWDQDSVDFISQFNPLCYKIPSACLTNDNLLSHCRKYGRPIILSTGMSDMPLIEHAVETLGTEDLIILHCTSTYPCKIDELNLKGLLTLKERFNVPIGYSGHEVGLWTTYAAAALGACVIERHITLDRAMWGSDQAASVEPQGITKLVEEIRDLETAMGNGKIVIYDSERPIMKKLRGY